MNNNPLVVYHGNCTDGFGAAWSFYKAQITPVENFVKGVYGNPPVDVVDTHIYLIDYSYPIHVVKDLLSKGNRITLIDHHKTAIHGLKPLIDSKAIDAYVDLEHSGAVLAWMYLYPSKPIPDILRYIEDRDLLRYVLPNIKEVQSTLYSYPYTFSEWDRLMERPLDELITDGKVLLRKHIKDICELLPQCTRRMVIGGYNVPVANLPYTYGTDAGAILAKNELFAATYYDHPDCRVFALHSDPASSKAIDVETIAKMYGGGGHKNAASFRVSYKKATEFEL